MTMAGACKDGKVRAASHTGQGGEPVMETIGPSGGGVARMAKQLHMAKQLPDATNSSKDATAVSTAARMPAAGAGASLN